MKININFDLDVSPDEVQEYQDIFDVLVNYEGLDSKSEIVRVLKESVSIKDFITESTKIICKDAAYRNVYTLGQLKQFLIEANTVIKLFKEFEGGEL